MGEAQRRHKLEVQVMGKLHEERLMEDRRGLEQHYASQVQVGEGGGMGKVIMPEYLYMTSRKGRHDPLAYHLFCGGPAVAARPGPTLLQGYKSVTLIDLIPVIRLPLFSASLLLAPHISTTASPPVSGCPGD